jgi:hypothetical protein
VCHGARYSGYWKCDGALDICISSEVVKSHSQGRQYCARFVGYTDVRGSNRTNRRGTWMVNRNHPKAARSSGIFADRCPRLLHLSTRAPVTPRIVACAHTPSALPPRRARFLKFCSAPLAPIALRIIGIVCQMRHTSRGQWCKVAHRVSESDDLEIIGGCNVGIRTGRDHSAYLFGSLARTRFVRAKSQW